MSLAIRNFAPRQLFDRIAASARLAIEPDTDRDFRINLIRATTFIISAMGIPAFHLYWSLGVHSIAWGIVASVSFSLANLWLLERTGRVGLAAHLNIASFYVLLLCDNVVTGGFHRPNFAWLYVVPMAAAVMLDLRGAWTWVGITLATMTGFWLLPEFGIVLTSAFPPELENGQALFSRITAVLSLGLVATAFVMIARRARRALHSANHDLARESRYVQLLQTAAVSSNEAVRLEEAIEQSVERIRALMGWKIGRACGVGADGRLAPLIDGRENSVDPELAARAVESQCPESRTDPGNSSAIALPVVCEGAVVAVLQFVADEPLEDLEQLLRVLTHVGTQIGRVAERSRLQARIRQSQKVEAVGQLAAGMAHEINNPMAYVRSNIQQLRTEVEARHDGPGQPFRRDDWLELLDDAVEGIERTIAIVSEVKDCGESHDAGGSVSDLNRIVVAALHDVTSERTAVARFSSTLGPALPPLHCLPNQLQRALVNLLQNGAQAAGPDGHVEVTTGSDGPWFFVRIEDDGPGIPDEHKSALFDPFFTTRAVGEGTGLGLYVACEIIATHGGEIRVDSTLGTGSRFEVRLPVDLAM